MAATLDEVAQRAGVSKTTVSRVINNRGYISTKTRNRVQAAIDELNYHPNSVARSLLGKSTQLIGLIFPNTSNVFYAEMIEHIETRLFKRGYKTILCNSFNDPQKEVEYLKMLQGNQVDGIITGSLNENIAEYRKLTLPIVSFDRYLGNRIPTVSSDNFEGGQLAAAALIRGKVKRVLLISTSLSEMSPTDDRINAFAEKMEQQKITYKQINIPFQTSPTMKKMFIRDEIRAFQPDGIMATDDATAMLVRYQLELLGKRVPQDVQVIGYDGTRFMQEAFPELSTIVQPIPDIAELLIELLIERIEDPEKELGKQYTLPVALYGGGTAGS